MGLTSSYNSLILKGEIYEGDIVSNVWIDEWYPNGDVFFDAGTFAIRTKSGHGDYHPCLYEAWSEKIEVIGNIYENPDLIKGGE